jgi:hypothetical protein
MHAEEAAKQRPGDQKGDVFLSSVSPTLLLPRSGSALNYFEYPMKDPLNFCNTPMPIEIL